MKITVVLPRNSLEPVGGYLVQYQLADQLAGGHAVTIVHIAGISNDGTPPIRAFCRELWRTRGRTENLAPWYTFRRGVNLRSVPWLSPRLLPKADVTILTAYQTAEAIHHATRRTGPLVQIVYDYEFWARAEPAQRLAIEKALSRSDITHIATSSSVRQMLEGFGATVAATVNPAISRQRFVCSRPPEERPLSIGFSYRREPHKGMSDLLSALEVVHRERPAVPIRCFRDPGPDILPNWVEQLGPLTDDQLVEFYNTCAIFVLPSHYEGWGLPAAEAMACGAALITTDSGGPDDFIEAGQTALVVPPRQAQSLASAILQLLVDDKLRWSIANAGSSDASAMTWEANAAATEAILRQVVDAGGPA